MKRSHLILLLALVPPFVVASKGLNQVTAAKPLHYKHFSLDRFKGFLLKKAGSSIHITTKGNPRLVAEVVDQNTTLEGETFDGLIESKTQRLKEGTLTGGVVMTRISPEQKGGTRTTTVNCETAKVADKTVGSEQALNLEALGGVKFVSTYPANDEKVVLDGSHGHFELKDEPGSKAQLGLNTADIDGPVSFSYAGASVEDGEKKKHTVTGTAGHMHVQRDGLNYVVNLSGGATFNGDSGEGGFNVKTLRIVLDQNFVVQELSSDDEATGVIKTSVLAVKPNKLKKKSRP